MKCDSCGKTLKDPWYKKIGWGVIDFFLMEFKKEVNDDAFCRGVAEGWKQAARFNREQNEIMFKRYGFTQTHEKENIDEYLQRN